MMKAFGKHISAFRRAKQMSLEWVAEQCQVKVDFIFSLEHGMVEPTEVLPFLSRLATTLEVSEEWLRGKLDVQIPTAE